MKTLKVTQTLRSAIYQAARAKLGTSERANLLLEAGLRQWKGAEPHYTTANARLWEEEADLSDFCKLRDLKEVETDETGRCELDLYVYAGPCGRGYDHRELKTNVAVLFDATGVLDAADVGERGPIALDPARAALWGCTEEEIRAWREVRERAPIG